jgi:hypothetical protein
MSLKLDLLSLWMPDFIMKKEIKYISAVTIGELDRLIQENTPSPITLLQNPKLEGSSMNMRMEMASAHEKRVKLLIQALGRKQALQLGKDALFNTGQELGSQLKRRLGVGDGLNDLIKAARILYKVLGIDFEVKSTEEGKEKIILEVNRCQLARYYSPDTCLVLSATDEGVVQGLNPNIAMKFTRRMAAGSDCCLASIQVKEENK